MAMDLREEAIDMTKGIASIKSDQAIVVSAQQRTLNLNGETIESGLPVVETATV